LRVLGSPNELDRLLEMAEGMYVYGLALLFLASLLLEGLLKSLLCVHAVLARRATAPAAQTPADAYPPLDSRYHHGSVGRIRPYTPLHDY
jgi:hypothetical protein